MFQRILFCQQTQFFTQFLPWKAAKVHKQPSKSTGGSKRQSDSPSNQGVNIPIAGHNALASLKKNAWKLCINSVWCHIWCHKFLEVIIFDPSAKNSLVLNHFLIVIPLRCFFQNQAEQESQARSSGSFSEFRSGSPNRKSLGRKNPVSWWMVPLASTKTPLELLKNPPGFGARRNSRPQNARIFWVRNVKFLTPPTQDASTSGE